MSTPTGELGTPVSTGAGSTIDVLTAIRRVGEELLKPRYSAFRNQLATPQGLPLELPDGWRFPYDLFLGTLRIRQAILVLFVTRSGEVEIEQDYTADVAQLTHEMASRRRAGSQQPLPSSPSSQVAGQADYVELTSNMPMPGAPSDEAVLVSYEVAAARVRQSYPDSPIRRADAVWFKPVAEQRWVPGWRFRLHGALSQSLVMVWSAATGGVQIDGPRASGFVRSSAPDEHDLFWRVGGMSFQQRTVTMTYQRGQRDLLSIGCVWACIAHASKQLVKLGYHAINLQDINIEHDAPIAATDIALFDIVDGMPTIRFPQRARIERDPTIILHELGHALWAILFARPHASVREQGYPREQEGVEEGFADYFAALMLSSFRPGLRPVVIGDRIVQPNRNGAQARMGRLPRVIGARGLRPLSDADFQNPEPHVIGQCWASLLWEFRSCQPDSARVRIADKLILDAHMRPRGGSSPRPLTNYLEGLQSRANARGLTADWDGLAATYGIPFVSPSTTLTD